MKTITFVSLLLMFSVKTFSQVNQLKTDSIVTQLNMCKKMFIDGVINEHEYKAMREKILGIKTEPQQIVIQSQNTDHRKSKDKLSSEEIKYRNVGTPCLVVSSIFTSVGAICLGAGYGSLKSQINRNKETNEAIDYNGTRGAIIAGIVLLCSSTPFWVSGSIEIGKANEIKREISDMSTKINIKTYPTAMILEF